MIMLLRHITEGLIASHPHRCYTLSALVMSNYDCAYLWFHSGFDDMVASSMQSFQLRHNISKGNHHFVIMKYKEPPDDQSALIIRGIAIL